MISGTGLQLLRRYDNKPSSGKAQLLDSVSFVSFPQIYVRDSYMLQRSNIISCNFLPWFFMHTLFEIKNLQIWVLKLQSRVQLILVLYKLQTPKMVQTKVGLYDAMVTSIPVTFFMSLGTDWLVFQVWVYWWINKPD